MTIGPIHPSGPAVRLGCGLRDGISVAVRIGEEVGGGVSVGLGVAGVAVAGFGKDMVTLGVGAARTTGDGHWVDDKPEQPLSAMASSPIARSFMTR